MLSVAPGILLSFGLGCMLGSVLEFLSRRRRLRGQLQKTLELWTGAERPPTTSNPRWGMLDLLMRGGAIVGQIAPVKVLVAALTHGDARANVQLLLQRAGLQASIQSEDVVAAQLVCATVFVGLYILVIGIGSLFDVMAVLLVGSLAYFGPVLLIRNRARRRQARIRLELIGAADIVAVIMSGGASLEQALRMYCQQFGGPLAQELQLSLHEITLGRPRRDALLALADRVDVDPLRHLVSTILHAERFGQPLAQILREQGRQLKLQRRQWVQAELARAPVKMLVPLATLLLPALLIVLIGPLILQILQHGLM